MVTLVILISECEEYMREVTSTTDIATLVGTSSSVIKVQNDCRIVNNLVVGGTVATTGQFPHMAALGIRHSNGEFTLICGGTLISRTWVLSAAHCTYGPKYILVIFFFRLKLYKNSGESCSLFFIYYLCSHLTKDCNNETNNT